MQHKFNKQHGKINWHYLLFMLPIIVSFISVLPSYLSLNDKEAKIYHSYEFTQIKIPTALNEQNILQLLTDNGIPIATLTVSLVNQGNIQADEIKISITNAAKALSIWTEPTIDSQPVWVNIPDLSNLNLENQKFLFTVSNLAVNKVFIIYIGYKDNPYIYLLNAANKVVPIPGLSIFPDIPWDFFHNEVKNKQKEYIPYSLGAENYYDELKNPIQIYYKGIQSVNVDNVNNVKPWSKYDVFELPKKILLYGFTIIFILLILEAAITNPTTYKYFSSKFVLIKNKFRKS